MKGKLIFGTTKTHSNRTVRLPRFLCDALTDHLADYPPVRVCDGLVFTSPTGSPLRHMPYASMT